MAAGGLVSLIAVTSLADDSFDSEDAFWAQYKEQHVKECLAASEPIIADVIDEVCDCTYQKIKENHTPAELLQSDISNEDAESYGEQCAYEVFDRRSTFTQGVRNEIVSSCREGLPELSSDEANAYCNCFVDKAEAEFTFTQVMKDEVSDANLDRLAEVCADEVFPEE